MVTIKNYKTLSVIIGIQVLLFVNIHAVKLKTEQVSIAAGLSHVSVKCIHQDKYGFLWFGTEDGLNRYDGYGFKIYKSVPGNPKSLIDNNIWDIEEDEAGNLWIATQEGVSFHNRITSEFVNYTLDSLDFERRPNTPLAADILVTKEGEIFAGTIATGLVKYSREKDRFENIQIESDLRISSNLDAVITMTEYGNKIYASDARYGLTVYDKDTKLYREVNIVAEGKKTPDFKNFNERISRLYVDQNDMLWVIADYGVYKLNTLTDELHTVHLFTQRDIFGLWMLNSAVCQDAEGNIWIGKDQRGLFRFDGISDDYTQVDFGEEYVNRPGIYNKMIMSMFTDNTGIIWIGTNESGVLKYDPASEPFTHYRNEPDNKFSIGGNEIFGIYESTVKPNTIYVGTRGTGLFSFNDVSKRFRKINLNFLNDIFGGSVRAILEDDDGSLYLGTWGDGLYKYTDKNDVKLISKWDSLNNSSLSNNLVRILIKDPDGFLWIGTNEGLNIYDPLHNSLKRVYKSGDPLYPQEIIDVIRRKNSRGEWLESILKAGNSEDASKEFAIERPRDYLAVSVGEGLDNAIYDYGWIENSDGDTIWSAKNFSASSHLNGAFKNRITVDIIRLTPGQYKLRYVSDESHSYGNWNAFAPLDSSFWGVQILRIEPDQAIEIKRVLNEMKGQPFISGANIRSIHMDNSQNNIVWIGTDAFGLDKYDRNTNTIINYRNDPKNSNSVSNNSIQYIHQDKRGILWLATNGGLNRFDPVSETFTTYRESDGLPTNYIASILEDDNENLWLATRNGLSRMTFTEGRATFVNYDSKDGLGGSDFIAQVALNSSKGLMYFGGEHGLNEFIPGKMNNIPPVLLLTDVKIGNRSVTNIKENTPITGTIYEADNIVLAHDQNDLSFEYAALHFGRAEKNQYAHFLEGYDEEWDYDNRRFAAYTNLDPGKYVFKFKGSNSDGVWNNKGNSIEITILPPWWLTIWAYIGYGLSFIGMIFAIDRIQRRRLLAKVREKRKIEEAEMRAETAELQAKAAEAERKMLASENDRKSRELEEARNLQLSMLPKELPNLPNLDIAVYMQTATEVGGDYYDFHVSMDGKLTVVLGDATGHGMKAGTMVTTTKGLFNVLAPNPDIVETFHEITNVLKRMHFEKLSMCLTMLKIAENKVQMSAAGMPPVFVYKRDGRVMEEYLMKGMPLGTMSNFPYAVKETELHSGDTILLMSDGLPELQNESDEIFGYKRVRNIFEENSNASPEEIIQVLKREGSSWVNGEDPDDDVTFVVIKVK